jgi:hypothetical protein
VIIAAFVGLTAPAMCVFGDEHKMELMGSRVLRLLVLFGSLPLALPQGWCCATAWSCPFECGAAKSAASCDAICPCRCQTAATLTCNLSSETPSNPSQCPAKSVCPCSDRHVTIPSKTNVETTDAGLVHFVCFVDVLRLEGSHRTSISERDVSPSTAPLHVLNCVWRC